MATGIQHVQATQLVELPPSSTRGVPALRNKKWQNSNSKCGTCFGGRPILYVYDGNAGTVLFCSFLPKDLFEEYSPDVIGLLNGLQIVEQLCDITLAQSNDSKPYDHSCLK